MIFKENDEAEKTEPITESFCSKNKENELSKHHKWRIKDILS